MHENNFWLENKDFFTAIGLILPQNNQFRTLIEANIGSLTETSAEKRAELAVRASLNTIAAIVKLSLGDASLIFSQASSIAQKLSAVAAHWSHGGFDALPSHIRNDPAVSEALDFLGAQIEYEKKNVTVNVTYDQRIMIAEKITANTEEKAKNLGLRKSIIKKIKELSYLAAIGSFFLTAWPNLGNEEGNHTNTEPPRAEYTINWHQGLQIRSEPSQSSPSLGAIPEGHTVILIERGDTYSLIEYSYGKGGQGYVLTRHLKSN
jgi:hypothetical protein